ncbi:cytochrome c4 [Alcanivorax sp. JB21]|uniref:c-type cytochrome n=1 Tax=Alcanivorax limicola TaxID=2874102 RepID=UPI001CBBE10E|nr:c-type cytochrome [Alcanivorax limicola]MBZ2188761.1 cytochrome c4 [Alcanivorax limicola]
MKSLKLFALVLAGVLAGQAHAGDAAAGEAKAAVCAACHGPDGNSPAADFPKIAGQGEKYFVKQLMDYKSGARENAIMRGQVAGLSEQDMKDLAAFYAAQPIEVGAADPDLVEAGERLYRGGNMDTGLAACSGCHGPAGDGIAAAGFPALSGQHARYIEEQLRAFRAAGRDDLGAAAYRRNDTTSDEPGMMQAIAAKMSDREIKAVASFISGLSK